VGKLKSRSGSSIVFFVIFGSIASGFQPALKERNVWPLMALSGIGTSGYLLFQFLAITAQRGGFIWESAVTWRILAPGLMAALVAPLFYWTLSQMDRLIPDGSRKMRTITR
jgi:NADH:ubiquinone oxidoreductase subunit 2 (subunit N)